MPELLCNPVNFLTALCIQDRIVIALAGLPGSGKSTFAQKIEKEVNTVRGDGYMKSVSMDGFHLTRQQLSQMPDPQEALKRRGAPWTFNPVGLIEKTAELREKKTVCWPGFEHGIGDPIENAIEIVPAVKIVLIEGLYLLYRENEWARMESIFDQLWFLNTSVELSFQRLVARHQKTKDLTEAEAIERANENDCLNGKTVLKTMDRADYLVECL